MRATAAELAAEKWEKGTRARSAYISVEILHFYGNVEQFE